MGPGTNWPLPAVASNVAASANHHAWSIIAERWRRLTLSERAAAALSFGHPAIGNLGNTHCAGLWGVRWRWLTSSEPAARAALVRSSSCWRTEAANATESRARVAVFTVGDARTAPSTPSVNRYLLAERGDAGKVQHAVVQTQPAESKRVNPPNTRRAWACKASRYAGQEPSLPWEHL